MTFLEKMTENDLASIKNLGYFLGSFDPLHTGHTEVIKIILRKKLCDAVFVYCVQGKSSWKHRSDFHSRTQLCELKLANTEGVILSYLSPIEVQKYLTTATQLPKNNNKCHLVSRFSRITAIIGADVACDLEHPNKNSKIEKIRQQRQNDFMMGIPLSESFCDSIACSIALPADDFIVALRENYNISDIPTSVCKRKVRAIIDTGTYRNISSSKIKRCLAS